MTLTRRQLLLQGAAAAAAYSNSLGSARPGPGEALTLRAAPGLANLMESEGAPTPALLYNGATPGPLLRVRHGGPLRLKFVNGLGEPTSLAFPGLRAPFANLVYGRPLSPGASLDVGFVPPNPGFNIYGALVGPDPRLQFARGLYGPLVVDEALPPAVDLDAIALISDWRLDDKNALAGLDDAAPGRQGGRIGTIVSVNGAPAPARFSAPPGARVRLRLANCATARVLNLAFDGLKPLVVAVDGEPSEPFEPRHNLLPVGSAARFELMFDFPRQAGASFRTLLREEGTPDREIIVFVASASAPAPQRPPIAALPETPNLPKEIALERSRRFTLTISGGGEAPIKLDGVPAAGPAFAVKRGAPVTLAIANKTAFPQTLRLCGHVARLLHDLDDGWEPYWRDIFVVAASKTIHAAFVADNFGLWPLESPSPECRNAGLATTFQVG